MVPFLNLGIARGCGWQHIGAYINLGAFYLCGIPVAAVLAFWVNLRGKGLWIGIQAGAFVQTLLLSIVTSLTNWEGQVYPLSQCFKSCKFLYLVTEMLKEERKNTVYKLFLF